MPPTNPVISGRNSAHIKNSLLGPAKLVTLSQQGVEPIVVSFDIVSREGQFSDTTIANYSSKGQGTLQKYLRNEGAKQIPVFLKGELTTQYEGVTPKTIGFDIIYRADVDLSPSTIRQRVMSLQSMCYPRLFIGLNPPLCILHILNLYSLEVYVTQVLVNWHNQWTNDRLLPREDQGMPMGCDISVTCLMHQYPTREEILCGAGFDSTNFMGTGYSGTVGQSTTTLSLDKDCVTRIEEANRAYNNALIAAGNAQKAAAQSARQAAANKLSLGQEGF